ncbi:hypothetical protein L3Q82_001913 [Scortum barcoo]|uniref:Uncharacterized protein n=1 Tax=Scortum barcoo TaxID=214431 RepID=A0ACB8W5Z6_9TELE|nr:hypothetical protein L3Q82_001913 [Scortum barcoo]
MSPGEVLADVNPEEPEAVDSLHRSPVDGEGGVFLSLPPPEVHDQLLSFAYVELEVVVLAPRCQGSDLLSVGRLVVAGDQANDGRVSSANLMMVLELWVATQSCVNREYSRGLSTQPWGAPVFRVRVEDVVLPIRTAWGLPRFLDCPSWSGPTLSRLLRAAGVSTLGQVVELIRSGSDWMILLDWLLSWD